MAEEKKFYKLTIEDTKAEIRAELKGIIDAADRSDIPWSERLRIFIKRREYELKIFPETLQ